MLSGAVILLTPNSFQGPLLNLLGQRHVEKVRPLLEMGIWRAERFQARTDFIIALFSY